MQNIERKCLDVGTDVGIDTLSYFIKYFVFINAGSL